jgi:hypothetical protein
MELLTNNPWEGNGPGTANFIELGVIVPRGPELEVPIATFRACSETFVAFSSPSTFRAAEASVITEALRAAAGRTAGTAGSRRTARTQTYDAANKIRRLGTSRANYCEHVRSMSPDCTRLPQEVEAG